MVARLRGHHVLPYQEVRHALTFRSSRTVGRMVVPGNGSLPLWGGSTNSKKAVNSTLCWPRGLDWPSLSSCFPRTPRGSSLLSRPRTSGRLSSSAGSGNKPAANASSRNFCHVAASSLTSSEPSFSPCYIVSSSPAVIELPTSGSGITRSRAVTRFNCTISTGPWLG